MVKQTHVLGDPTMRWRAWAAVVGGILVGQVVWIIQLRGPRILDSDLTLILGQLLLCMGLIVIAGLISTTTDDAIKLSRRQSWWIIIGGTVVFQVLGLLLLWPGLSSDVVRYRLDGLSWIAGQSPYVHPPAELLRADSVDAIDQTVSGRDVLSIYPPVAQTIFVAARAIEMVAFGPAKLEGAKSGTSIKLWRQALPRLGFWHRAMILRIIFALSAVGAVLVLLSILDQWRQTLWMAVLFAWNPLLVLETAGNGHVDIVGILLLLTMIRMMQKKNFALASIALCLACGVRPMAIVIAPVLIRQVYEYRNWQVARRCVWMSLMTLLIVFLPVLLIQHGYRGWLTQLGLYGKYVESNSLLFTIGKFITAGNGWMTHPLRWFMLSLLPLGTIPTLIWCIRRALPTPDAAYWLMLVPLLLGPVASPWMILWPLCFVPLMRFSNGWAALTWTATAALAYAAWRQSAYVVPTRIVIAEYLPVLLAMAIQTRELLGYQPFLRARQVKDF